jgi:hypothetical protein
MSNCCDKNPLQRSGTNQLQRLLPGLQPGYVLVDERDYADWIFFADEFSRYLKFYELTGTVTNTWKPFFSTDLSAILGTIAVQNVELYRRSIKERLDFIRDDENESQLTTVKQRLNELFSGILSLSIALDGFIRKLPDKDINEKEFVFKTSLLSQVRTKLAPALKRLLSYYKAVDDDPNSEPDFLEPSNMTGWKVLNTQVESVDVILAGTGLSKNWWVTPAADWAAYRNSITADDSVFGPSGWLDYRRINHAAHHNLFTSIFDLYLQAYSKIVQEAEIALLGTLKSWDAHPAHYTLFLSFLKLFRFAQADINTVTQRHLDFYYKEILQLRPREAQPNHAHIILELAKQKEEHALKQGAEFKAGKDSEGKDVVYELDRETTFNKAKVALLKTIYKGDEGGKDNHLIGPDTINNAGRLFSSFVTNSDDGNGAKLKSANKEWHPFVNKKYTEGELSDIAMPNAQIGFAIASHYLYLTEGEREVSVKIATANDPSNALIGKTVDCYLTTEKGWHAVPGVAFTSSTIIKDGSHSCAMLNFTLSGDVPAITNYNAAVHKDTYNVNVPLLKVYLRNTDGTTEYDYNDLMQITISLTEISVQVGYESSYTQKGMKQLLLSNDFGPIDPSKPFMPFGAQPKRDASFVIGNKEVFSKQNASVQLNIEWAGVNHDFVNVDYDADQTAEANISPSIRLDFLSSGVWSNIMQNGVASSSFYLFDFYFLSISQTKYLNIPASYIRANVPAAYEGTYGNYDSASKSGFMKLVLMDTLGHKEYLDATVLYLIDKANGGDPDKPEEPYTPVIKSIYLSYSANIITEHNVATKSNYDSRSTQFFHIYPFGEAEQHSYINNSLITLLPQFNHYDTSGRKDHIGEFYIGLEQLSAEQAVNILFQVMEGSSDPLVAKPEEHIHWSFLSNNHWVPFLKEQINDNTRQLVQSGIISFVIPGTATTNNKILPTGYLWLRASVTEAAGAICKLVSVDAQAAVVTFDPHNNAADFLNNALPAGTISKLKLPDAAVKKIEQNYSSFGGRVRESNSSYYVRASERLRHKARAITIWDYEHLVLEAFPSIHKVKCLNHTKFDKKIDSDDIEYNEVLPGNVTVITIPDLKNRNDANPLRPYTNQNLLLEIEEYLRQRISCHVKLKVKNPRFEEVWVTFKMKMMKGYTGFTYYSDLLKQEITQFLTPWAYNSGIDIQFGGKIHKSVLIDFIEERPYVDYITDVLIYHDSNPDNENVGSCDDTPSISTITGGEGVEIVEASTARSILVSTPASKHLITNIEDEEVAVVPECAGAAPSASMPAAPIITIDNA